MVLQIRKLLFLFVCLFVSTRISYWFKESLGALDTTLRFNRLLERFKEINKAIKLMVMVYYNKRYEEGSHRAGSRSHQEWNFQLSSSSDIMQTELASVCDNMHGSKRSHVRLGFQNLYCRAVCVDVVD